MTVEKTIDGVRFTLRADHDFAWLHQYGKLFRVFDQQDSGNICFGVDDGIDRWFIKYAGAPTVNYDGTPSGAILWLKGAIPVYEAIQHPNLIRLIRHAPCQDGYALIYAWADGECLHAHWDFEKRPKHSHPESPNYRFARLDLEHKLACLDAVFSVHRLVAEKDYVAIDFYDGSVMYDFRTHRTTVCDIDFYQKAPGAGRVVRGRKTGDERRSR